MYTYVLNVIQYGKQMNKDNNNNNNNNNNYNYNYN